MKNQLKPKIFLIKRNIIIALVAVFLTAGAVTAIVVSKNGGNGESQTSAGEATNISESVKSSESFDRDEKESENDTESCSEIDIKKESDNERESEKESPSDSEQESLSASERESEQTSEVHIHSFDRMIEEEKYFASEATCAQRAKYYYSCECGEAGERTFEVGGFAEHTPVIDKGYAATCGDDGLTDGTHCSVCGAIITAREIIPAVGHNYESGICSVCEDVELTDNKYFTFTLLSGGGYSIGASSELKSSSLNGVKLPAAYNEQPVVSVAVNGFDGCQFTKLIVPEGIISLCVASFGNCDKLESVSLPDSLTEVSAGAFKYCSSLKDIVIPDSVENIGIETFIGCSALENLTIPFVGDRKNAIATDSDIYSFGYIFGTTGFENSYYVSQHYKYNKSYRDSVFYFPLSLKYVTVTCGEIFSYAFEGCVSLKKIDIPQNITQIGEYAFCACGIGPFDVPSGVTRIENNTFSSCDRLKEIKLPSGLKEIGYGAFLGCDSFVDIELPSAVEKIDMCAFQMCDRLKSVVIPNSVTEILYGVFADCESLESITVPCIGYTSGKDIYPISDWFGFIYDDKYDSTKYYRIPRRYYDDVYGWGIHTSGEYVKIPLSFKSVTITSGESVYGFEDLSSLVSVALPETVKRIESYAFLECANLEKINFPEGLEYIGEGAFAGCEKLENVEFPDFLIEIGEF